VQDNFLEEVGVDLRGLGDNTGGLGIRGKGGLRGTAGVTTPVTFDDVFFGSVGNPTGSNLGNTGGTTSIGTGNDTGIYYQIQGRGDDIRARFQNLYDVTLGKAGVLTTAGGLTFQGTMIDDTQLEVILRAVQKSDRSTVVTAPRLTAYNGQRANVQVLNQQSYISDFDVEIAQASQIGDPIVQTLRDGVILDLRPVVSADRRYITMELRPTVAILTRPIATFQTTLANGPPVTIQLPELAVSRVRTTVTMPDGGTLLLGGLKYFQEQRLDATVAALRQDPARQLLFSRKGTYLEKRNVLVLIRAASSVRRRTSRAPAAGCSSSSNSNSLRGGGNASPLRFSSCLIRSRPSAFQALRPPRHRAVAGGGKCRARRRRRRRIREALAQRGYGDLAERVLRRTLTSSSADSAKKAESRLVLAQLRRFEALSSARARGADRPPADVTLRLFRDAEADFRALLGDPIAGARRAAGISRGSCARTWTSPRRQR